MAEKDFHQITTPPHNEPITHVFLAKIKNLILHSLVGGNGIRVSRMGENVIIETDTAPRGLGSSGGANVSTVEALPAIPSSGMLEVYWTSTGAGTGDNQVWRAYAGQTSYTPTQKLSNNSGVPV